MVRILGEDADMVAGDETGGLDGDFAAGADFGFRVLRLELVDFEGVGFDDFRVFRVFLVDFGVPRVF